MDELELAFTRVAEAILAQGAVPENVIVGLERLRNTVGSWLSNKSATLYAPVHGRAVVTPSGAYIDLSGRPTLRRLVETLVERRLESPGQALTAAELVAIGWPGTAASSSASANRLRVALCRLRRAGLDDLLVTTRDGWMLDPTVPVERCTV